MKKWTVSVMADVAVTVEAPDEGAAEKLVTEKLRAALKAAGAKRVGLTSGQVS